MKSFWVIFNLIAACGLILLGSLSFVTHRRDAWTVYHELERQKVLVVEGSSYDVIERLRSIGGGGGHATTVGLIGAFVCVSNVIGIVLMGRRNKP